MRDESKTWAWMLDNDDIAHGLFLTREGAVGDAMEQNGSLAGVKIGHGVWPVPSDHMPDMDYLMDTVEDIACDNGYGFWDDAVFEAKDQDAARADLDAALKTWADKHLTANCWMFVPEAAAQGRDE